MEKSRGMKWHKILIWFVLWIFAIVNVFFGGALLWLRFTTDAIPVRYFGKPALQAVVDVLAVIQLASGLYGVVVRFLLARCKRKAPLQLFVLQLAGTLAWALLLRIDMDVSLLSAIPGIALAFINRCYYRKRADRFVK